MAGGVAFLLCLAVVWIPRAVPRRPAAGGSHHSRSVLSVPGGVRKYQGSLLGIVDSGVAGNRLPWAPNPAVWLALFGVRVGNPDKVQRGCRPNLASSSIVFNLGQYPWFVADWHGPS